MFKVNIVTLFPEVFPGTLDISICKRARENKLWDLNLIDIKKYAYKSKIIDSPPFGGGPGMIIRPDVLQSAYNECLKTISIEDKEKIPKIMLSPRGKRLDQNIAKKLSKAKGIVLVSGRYEGVDDRFVSYNKLTEISVGDYVLMGGEAAAMVLIETVLRNIPKVLGNSESLKQESFSADNLEYPQYTKPRVWKKIAVPEVLLTGNHSKIEKWRADKSRDIVKVINNKKKQ